MHEIILQHRAEIQQYAANNGISEIFIVKIEDNQNLRSLGILITPRQLASHIDPEILRSDFALYIHTLFNLSNSTISIYLKPSLVNFLVINNASPVSEFYLDLLDSALPLQHVQGTDLFQQLNDQQRIAKLRRATPNALHVSSSTPVARAASIVHPPASSVPLPPPSSPVPQQAPQTNAQMAEPNQSSNNKNKRRGGKEIQNSPTEDNNHKKYALTNSHPSTQYSKLSTSIVRPPSPPRAESDDELTTTSTHLMQRLLLRPAIADSSAMPSPPPVNVTLPYLDPHASTPLIVSPTPGAGIYPAPPIPIAHQDIQLGTHLFSSFIPQSRTPLSKSPFPIPPFSAALQALGKYKSPILALFLRIQNYQNKQLWDIFVGNTECIMRELKLFHEQDKASVPCELSTQASNDESNINIVRIIHALLKLDKILSSALDDDFNTLINELMEQITMSSKSQFYSKLAL